MTSEHLFTAALAQIMRWEGGYVNHPSDPGGHTNLGITLATYRRVKPDATPADLKALTHKDAGVIYRDLYWLPARCDALPGPLALMMFDCAVNQGVKRAHQLLERATRTEAAPTITDDLIRRAQAGDVALDFAARRALHYASLPHLQTFGRGWMRRLLDTMRVAALPPFTATAVASPKVVAAKAKPRPKPSAA
jgi:lysozyme family protein